MVVRKFGGSSLKDTGAILHVADFLAKEHRRGVKQICIVSAMGHTTNDLLRLAKEVSPTPNRRELDLLMSAGERISMALLGIALNARGIPALSFTGSQAGIFTTGGHNQAYISDLRPIRVEEALKQNKLVVLAGFQGVDPTTKEVTTLGRGGSDTTAVAVAGHFKARCLMYKDVRGLFTADPKVIPAPCPVPKISPESMLESCFWGAKVLHWRAVNLARQCKVPLEICHTQDFKTYTTVQEDKTMYEKPEFVALNIHPWVKSLEVKSESLNGAYKKLKDWLREEDTAAPQILAANHQDGATRFLITSDKDHLERLSHLLEKTSPAKDLGSDSSAINLTFSAPPQPELWDGVFALLTKEGIRPQKILPSPLGITFTLPKEGHEKAAQRIHSWAAQGLTVSSQP